jgi:hypothetical protein
MVGFNKLGRLAILASLMLASSSIVHAMEKPEEDSDARDDLINDFKTSYVMKSKEKETSSPTACKKNIFSSSLITGKLDTAGSGTLKPSKIFFLQSLDDLDTDNKRYIGFKEQLEKKYAEQKAALEKEYAEKMTALEKDHAEKMIALKKKNVKEKTIITTKQKRKKNRRQSGSGSHEDS